MVYYRKDYLKVYARNGYVYIEDEYTKTNVALNDGDYDGVIEALRQAKGDAFMRRIAIEETITVHNQDGKLVF